MGNAKAFGVMPSVKADAKVWSKLYPQFAAFLAGADYSKSIPTVPDIATVLGDFNQQLQGLPNTDPKTILDRVNSELQSILNQVTHRRTVKPAGGDRAAGGRRPDANGRKGGESGDARRSRPLVAAARARDPRSSGGGGLAVPRAGDRHPRRCSSCVPIAMAAWVSVSDWNGNGSPFGPNAHFVGLENYRHLLTTPGLDQNNFGTSLRNNLYYVLFVVPIQTAVCALPGRPRQPAPEGRRVLPDGVLLPVGHELGRDHGPLPLPLLADRRDQQAPVVLRRDRAGVALRPARPLSRHPRASSASTSRQPRSRTSSSSASATGTGCPARASRCASSS